MIGLRAPQQQGERGALRREWRLAPLRQWRLAPLREWRLTPLRAAGAVDPAAEPLSSEQPAGLRRLERARVALRSGAAALAQSGATLGGLPPAGERRSWLALLRALTQSDPAGAAARALRAELGVASLQLRGSGRDALRSALGAAAALRGRREVILPAYTCFSVAAAAAAAGLRVHLVDVTPQGRIDLADLDRLPLERAAALVVCNLFGLPEPLAPLRERARAAGVLLLDDAAQAFGAADADGPVGARGEPGVFSFGRGKPLCALGGGALSWPGSPPALPPPPRPERLAPLRALARSAAYELALSRWMFPVLAALPQLGVGETPFAPDFSRDPLDAATAALLLDALAHVGAQAEQRRAHAHALAVELRALHGAWQPLLGEPGQRGAFARLALLAPSAAARERALARLAGLGAGASALYPRALCELPALRPHRADGERALPGARELAARVLTLPTHGRLRGARLQQSLEALAQSAAQSAAPGTRS